MFNLTLIGALLPPCMLEHCVEVPSATLWLTPTKSIGIYLQSNPHINNWIYIYIVNVCFWLWKQWQEECYALLKKHNVWADGVWTQCWVCNIQKSRLPYPTASFCAVPAPYNHSRVEGFTLNTVWVVSYVQPSTYSLKNRHCIGDGGKCCEKRILLLLLLIGCVGNGQLHMIAGLKNEVFGILSITWIDISWMQRYGECWHIRAVEHLFSIVLALALAPQGNKPNSLNIETR